MAQFSNELTILILSLNLYHWNTFVLAIPLSQFIHTISWSHLFPFPLHLLFSLVPMLSKFQSYQLRILFLPPILKLSHGHIHMTWRMFAMLQPHFGSHGLIQNGSNLASAQSILAFSGTIGIAGFLSQMISIKSIINRSLISLKSHNPSHHRLLSPSHRSFTVHLSISAMFIGMAVPGYLLSNSLCHHIHHSSQFTFPHWPWLRTSGGGPHSSSHLVFSRSW